MKLHIWLPPILVSLALGSPCMANNNQQQQSQERRSPPEAAFNACSGKTAGEKSEFENHRGKVITGTCEMFGGMNAGKLIMRPDKRRTREHSRT